jgi:hypothetical protein
MKQFNLNVDKEFERDLKLLMKHKRVKRKSDALRQLVHDEAEKIRKAAKFDFSSFLGIALKYPENPNPKFKTEDDLWS